MCTAAPRNFYLDIGVNWCNTLSLHKSVPEVQRHLAGAPWHVVGFEASPYIMPFADDCMRALNRGFPLPAAPVPTAGSTRELRAFAPVLGCTMLDLGLRPQSRHDRTLFSNGDVFLNCTFRALEANLSKLVLDPTLRSERLLEQRISQSTQCGPARLSDQHDEYTLIPAAVGAENGTLTLVGGREQALRGGVMPPGISSAPNARGVYERHAVRSVDLGWWLRTAVRREDFVVVKMDVEGAEHTIVPSLIEQGAADLIDVWLWECHFRAGSTCRELESSLRGAGIPAVYKEPYSFLRAQRGQGHAQVPIEQRYPQFGCHLPRPGASECVAWLKRRAANRARRSQKEAGGV